MQAWGAAHAANAPRSSHAVAVDQVGKMHGHDLIIWACEFSVDGSRMYSGSSKKFGVWNMPQDTLVQWVEDHRGDVRCISTYYVATGGNGAELTPRTQIFNL